MKGLYRYCILKEIGLIIQFHQNDLTLEGIKKLKLDIINDKDFSPDYKFIVDVRLTTVVLDEYELEQYGNFVSENLKLTGSQKLALLTDTPEQAAKSIIYTLNKKIHPLKYGIYSTLEASLNWLDIDTANIGLIESEIKKNETT